MKKVVIVIKEKEVKLNLLEDEREVDTFCFSEGLNFGESLLGEIDGIILKNGLSLGEIGGFEVKNEISDNFTSVKIAQIVAKTLNFAKTVD